MRSSLLLLLAVFSAACITASAHQTYQRNIPNGIHVMRNGVPWPGVGHHNSGGGGPRNPFGQAFAVAGHTWTTTLCQQDSDGDGFTNGQELGDPDCVWSAGLAPTRASDISHPGFADSVPAGETSVPVLVLPPTSGANGICVLWGRGFLMTLMLTAFVVVL